MRIISGVINTRFTHRRKERGLQRTPMKIMAVACAASALAFGVIGFAAEGPSHDVSAALGRGSRRLRRARTRTLRGDGRPKTVQILAFSGIKPGTRCCRLMLPTQAISRVSSPASSAPRVTFT